MGHSIYMGYFLPVHVVIAARDMVYSRVKSKFIAEVVALEYTESVDG